MNNMNNFQRNTNFAPFYNASPVGVGTSTNNIVQVQGIEGAKAWQLNPNSMVILLDSEAEGKMYIKVSDNIGMSTLRTFNYIEEVPTPASTNVTINQDLDLSQYVRKDELSALIKEAILGNESTLSIVGGSSELPDSAPADSSKPKTIILGNNAKK